MAARLGKGLDIACSEHTLVNTNPVPLEVATKPTLPALPGSPKACISDMSFVYYNLILCRKH